MLKATLKSRFPTIFVDKNYVDGCGKDSPTRAELSQRTNIGNSRLQFRELEIVQK